MLVRNNKHNIFYRILSIVVIFVFLFLLFSCKKKEEQLISKTESDVIERQEEEGEEKEENIELSEEEVPGDIQNLINKADSYFENGECSLASTTYKDAIEAVEDLDVLKNTKQQLLNDLNFKYQEAKEIVNVANMHYRNAMQLEYEKRFEEAIEEIELALDLYPKYQPAIDALETLKAIEDLN